ncbi:uncharacterized protein LOC119638792 [Glossina fuscipes]|uniref:Uncharacterized protein LOC119638792 n=2 Tax=Nemorhina TaxID=44051 RepID=A0A9C5Z8D0_9MUSC|nr:uncharacterized protein LOC119638792 [Glossina fuscipes]KAI9580551.1 hypothetical protein GQX74_012632 [Glossina fuscipes]
MTSCKVTVKRLLKCFCGCQEMTEEEVQRLYQLNVQATLIDHRAVKIFKSFLKQSRCGENITEQYLDVYEQCGAYMLQDDKILTLDELDELSDLGLPYDLERDLRNQIRTGDCDNINRCLLRIQGECRNKIERSQEYKNYKAAILSKLNQIT